MLISCKCLNFIATSAQQLQKQHALANFSSAPATPTEDDNSSVATALMQVFLQKYPRNFIFYSQCMDFFKQALQPISDLTINAISQRDLIYSLTLDILPATGSNRSQQSWQLSFCINCNTTLCAKRLQPNGGSNSTNPFLINYSLLTNNEEIAQRRADKSFSETFSLLIIDHPQLEQQQNSGAGSGPNNNTMASSLITGSLTAMTLDAKQQRMRQLQLAQQTRLKREIAETDERIQRYTEQQFALLKSFRDKSKQEYGLLVRLIQQVPETPANEWLDRSLPALEINGGAINYAATRRRNTISSRRDLINVSGATTPSTLSAHPPNFLALPASVAEHKTGKVPTPTQNTIPTAVVTSSITARKLSNFDTPPATPEAVTPMSVGNSPTFRQFPNAVSTEAADDCLFELEDVDAQMPLQQNYQNQLIRINYQRHLSLQPPHENNMSDLDESDTAEEAEDALDLDSSMPITMQRAGYRATPSQIFNFAKSLPIEIANSPLSTVAVPVSVNEEEDDLDNNVDIAASIKALAKSVHGNDVFGDLPRPRLRSQI